MSWLDDLEALGSAAINVARPVLRPIGQAFDWSEEHGKEWAGDYRYYMNRATPSWADFILSPGQDRNEVLAARRLGGSGRAVWESQQGNLENQTGLGGLAADIARGSMTILNPLDPINALGYAFTGGT